MLPVLFSRKCRKLVSTSGRRTAERTMSVSEKYVKWSKHICMEHSVDAWNCSGRESKPLRYDWKSSTKTITPWCHASPVHVHRRIVNCWTTSGLATYRVQAFHGLNPWGQTETKETNVQSNLAVRSLKSSLCHCARHAAYLVSVSFLSWCACLHESTCVCVWESVWACVDRRGWSDQRDGLADVVSVCRTFF